MELQIKCLFSFNGKKVQSVHLKVEECLVSRDAYMAIRYEEEKSKKPFKTWFLASTRGGGNIFPLYKDTISLKEPGLLCFLLRCKRYLVEAFMQWAVETVLPREVQKLVQPLKKRMQHLYCLLKLQQLVQTFVIITQKLAFKNFYLSIFNIKNGCISTLVSPYRVPASFITSKFLEHDTENGEFEKSCSCTNTK